MVQVVPLFWKAVSYLPLAPKYFHGMRIVWPSAEDTVGDPKIVVRGTCSMKPPGDWVLFTHRGERWWPQDDVQFNHTDSTWSGSVHLNLSNKEPTTIMVALVTQQIRYAVDYYRELGSKTGEYPGIKMSRRPEGVKIAAQVSVHKKPAPAK